LSGESGAATSLRDAMSSLVQKSIRGGENMLEKAFEGNKQCWSWLSFLAMLLVNGFVYYFTSLSSGTLQ
jgi:hypothetical protein